MIFSSTSAAAAGAGTNFQCCHCWCKCPRGGVTAGPGPEADTRHCSHYGDVEEGGETVMKMGHAAQILINLDPPYHGPVLSTSCYVVC